MNKYRIAYFVLFFFFYVLWLFKGDEWLGVENETAVRTGQAEVSDVGPQLDAGIRFAWLLGY